MPARIPNPPMDPAPRWSLLTQAIPSPLRAGFLRAIQGATASDRVCTDTVYRALLVAIVFLVFGPSIAFDYSQHDDAVNTFQNPFLNPPMPGNVLALWIQSYEGLYIPVTYTAWAFVGWISSLLTWTANNHSPAGYHFANLLVHLISVLLVFSILRSLFTSPRPGRASCAAFAGAALFAVHPCQVEPVAWITGMKDLLSAALALAAIRIYLKNSISSGKEGLLSSPRRLLEPATVLFVAALLAKPSAVAAIPIAFLLEITFLTAEGDRRAAAKRAARRLLPWIIVSLIVIVLSKSLQPSREGVASAPLWFRPVVLLDSLGFYLQKLIWPALLGPDYGRTPQSLLTRGFFGVLWWLPLAVTALLLALRRNRTLNLLIFALFTCALLPYSGLISFNFQIQSTVADRYAYLAMLAAALLTTRIFLACRVPALRGAILLVVALFAVRSMSYLPVFTNSETYYRHAITVNPASAHNRFNLANEFRLEERFDEAIAEYRILLRLFPAMDAAAINLGDVYYQLGDYAESENLYRRALEVSIRNAPTAHQGLAHALSASGKYIEADHHFLAAVRRDPNSASRYLKWAKDLEKRNRFSYAAEVYQEAAHQTGTGQESSESAIILRRLAARSWWKAGDTEKCLEQVNRILSASPEDTYALNMLSWIKATSVDEALRDSETAIRLAEKVCELTQYKEPYLLDTLASAYASAQRYRRAIATLDKMVEAAKKSDHHDIAQVHRVFRNRIWYYANAQPLEADNARLYSEFEEGSLTAQVEE